MAAILGTACPEVFSSVVVHSGLAAGAAQNMSAAFGAMRSGGQGTEPLPLPDIVFHEMADRTVVPANGAAVARSVAEAAKPRRRTRRIGGRQVVVTRSDRVDGRPATEYWEIDGLGHAWSGGDAAGSYADPLGPDAMTEMLRFFPEVDGR